MPRDGSQEYHAPFPDVVEGTTIESTVYNGFVNDIVIDLNTPRPVKYGGTGADNSADAMQNLGGELSKQLVTNYDIHPFQAGSFYSAASASGAPTGNAFTGICYVAVIAGVATTDMFLEARDQTTGLLYVRQKKANVWGGWTVPAGFSPGATPPAGAAANSLWWDTTRGKLFFYYQDPSGPPAQWVEAVAVPDIDPNTFVEIAGDTMTGFLTLNANAVNPLHAVPKQQLDARFTGLYAAPFDALAYNGMQINGSMEVSQESGGTLLTITNAAAAKYIVDGWTCSLNNTGSVLKAGQSTGNVISGVYFPNILYFQSTTALSALGANDYAFLSTPIEGWRCARLGWGTAAALPVTVAFWVAASATGQLAVIVRNAGGTRSYASTVAVNAPSVWEYKTLTVPGDTSGTWLKDNGTGLTISISGAAGTSAQIAPNTWSAGNFLGATGMTNFFTTNGNSINITGVVVLPGIEAPSAARSPLIMRPYDQELLTCQRYYEKTYDYGTALSALSYVGVNLVYAPTAGNFMANVRFQTRKRAQPTVVVYSPQNGATGNVFDGTTNRVCTPDFVGDASYRVTCATTANTPVYWHHSADARL